MMRENNWLTHNLSDRLTNKNSDLNISINVQNYNKLSFEQAAKEVCEKLHTINKNIYIGLSGGIDSEYVFKKFYSLNIPFTPVIVYSNCYIKESAIAFEICKEYGIEPLVITISEADIISQYKTDIYDTLNSFGIGGVPALVIAKYAKEHGGIYVKAEHMIGDINNNVAVEVNEWDFYNDVITGYTYDFFTYTPEIVYSMVSNMGDTDSQTYKCNLYNIPYRKKITVTLSSVGLKYYHWTKINMEYTPSYHWSMKPTEFLERYF